MTEADIKKLQQENAKLRADLAQEIAARERIQDEAAKKMDALRKGLSEGKIVPVETPGLVELTIRPSGGGKSTKRKYGIAPGFPKVRLEGAKVVQSTALMKVATGEELTDDELKANPALKGWDKKQACDFLAANAAIQAGWLVAQ